MEMFGYVSGVRVFVFSFVFSSCWSGSEKVVPGWPETGPPHLPPRHICVTWYWGGGEVKHQLLSPIILPLVDIENSGVGTLLLVVWFMISLLQFM